MDPRQALDRIKQGVARLRQGLAARSALDKLRKTGVRLVPEVETMKAAADAENFFVDDAFSGSRLFAPRVVLVVDPGEADDAVAGIFHTFIEHGLITSKDAILVAGESGIVDYQRTEAFVAITFEAAMALNEKKDRNQVKQILKGAGSPLDLDTLLAGIEHAVAQNLMLLVLRSGNTERYPLVFPSHFLYRLYPELEGVGVPIEFDDDIPASRAATGIVRAQIARGAYWSDASPDLGALAEYFNLTAKRVDERFAPAIMQSASLGRVYQILGVADYLIGNLPALLQENGVPYMVIAPRQLPQKSATGFHVQTHAAVNEGVPAALAPPAEEEAAEPTLTALEPLSEDAPSTEEFAVAAATRAGDKGAPVAPAPQAAETSVPNWERKDDKGKGGLKFKRVRLPGSEGEASPPPPPPVQAVAPPPPPPPLIHSLPGPAPTGPELRMKRLSETAIDEPPPPPMIEEPQPPPPPPRIETEVVRAPPPPPPPPPPPKSEPAVVRMPPPPPPKPEPVVVRATAPPPSAEPGPVSEVTLLDEVVHESRRGVVRAATDEALRRAVVVRLGPGEEAISSAGFKELEARARLLEKARGAGVPAVLALTRTREGAPGLAMPRYRGDDLLLARTNAADALTAPFVSFAASEWMRVADALLRVLARLHGAGVVHAGVHPARVLWGEEDGLILLGWGLAGEAGATLDGRFEHDRYDAEGKPGEPVRSGDAAGRPGTAGFSAPEWLAGGATEYAPTLDVHAAAATLWFLWTGRAPGEAGEGPLPPPAIAAVLKRAMDADPKRRPQDARRLARLLTQQGAGLGAAAE